MTIKRVMFIRPGETEWNRIGRWQGQVEVPLNAHGIAQAERLAQFVRNLHIDMLYTSDLRRAVQTAETICHSIGVHPIHEPRLRERHVGQWQGLTIDEVKDWYAEDYARLLANPLGYQIPGGESRQQVRKRARDAFQSILERGGDTVGILTHTVVIMELLAELLQDYDPDVLQFNNISVTTISRKSQGASWHMAQINDVSHLDGMVSRSVTELGEKNA